MRLFASILLPVFLVLWPQVDGGCDARQEKKLGTFRIYPDSDVSISGLTSPVWSKIDEDLSTPSILDLVKYNNVTGTFRVTLTDGPSGLSSHIGVRIGIFAEFTKDLTGASFYDFNLYNGATKIASGSSTAWQDDTPEIIFTLLQFTNQVSIDDFELEAILQNIEGPIGFPNTFQLFTLNVDVLDEKGLTPFSGTEKSISRSVTQQEK